MNHRRSGSIWGLRARRLSVATCLLVALVAAGCEQPAAPTLATLPTDTSAATSTPLPADAATPTQRPTASLPAAPLLLEPVTVAQAPIPGHGAEAVAALGERAYVCNRASDNVSVIEDGRVVAVVPVGRAPSALTADPASARVYVLNEDDSTLSVIEGDTVEATWPLDVAASTIALVGEELWLGTQRGDALLVLDARDGALLARAPLSATSAVFTLVPHLPSGRVFVATYGRVHAVAVRTLEELAVVSLPSYRALGVSPDGARVYVGAWDTERQRSVLQVLNADGLQSLDSIALGGDVTAILSDPHDGRIYVIGNSPGELIAYDPQSLQETGRLITGLGASAAALSADGGRLYVTHRDGENLVVVDTSDLVVSAAVPLTLRIDDLAVDAGGGRLLAAVGGADSVHVLGEGAPAEPWLIEGYPYRVAALPETGGAAVLSRADGLVRLLDEQGRVTYSVGAGRFPDGLSLDESMATLYAGEIVLSLSSLTTDTLRVPTIYGTDESPRDVVRDTRRNRLYVVAFNGTPGSNGGYSVTRFGPAGAYPSAPAPGRLSVVDLLYDAANDRFFSTNARMGTFGLQVSAGVDCRELLYLPLDGYPVAIALNPTTQHLWVALQRMAFTGGDAQTQIVAYDARSLGEVARLDLDDTVACIAVDSTRSRVCLGSAASGLVHVIQDVPMLEPPGPTPTFTSTPWPTATLTAQPSVTPTAVPTATRTVTAAPAPTVACAVAPDSSLQAIWQASAGREWLGCPTDAAQTATWAAQPFVRGLMLWRPDTRVVYVLRGDGTYTGYSDTWQEGMPAESCAGIAPEGLFKPQRGFGLVWCNVLEVPQSVGWATEGERAVSATWQPCERGFLLLDDLGVAYALGTDGTWAQMAP